MQKDYGLSVIRFLAMGCVIFCHCLEQSNHRVTGNYLAVGVQLFLLLSGYLYSHREFGDSKSRINFVIRNFYKILLDYYVYLILFVIPIYFWLDRQQITSSSIYRLATCSGNFGGIHHLWYIPYCLFCYLITPWLYDIKCAFFEENKGYVGGILKIGALGLGTHIIMVAYGSYFLPDKIICYILGYFLPYILKNKKGISVVFGVNAIFMVFSNTIRYYYKYVWDVSYFSKSSIRRLDLLYDYACISLGLFIFLTVFFLTRKMRGGGICRKFWTYQINYRMIFI